MPDIKNRARSLTCPICKTEFVNFRYRNEHIAKSHFKEEMATLYGTGSPWNCSLCNKDFNRVRS